MEGNYVVMDRLKDYTLSEYVKEDLIDLLETHPTLFEMSEDELTQLIRDKYWTAQGFFDQGNRLESDADSIEKYRDAKYRKKDEQ